MELISTKDRLPNNEKFRMVILKDGLHICGYHKDIETWKDREGWYHNYVTHWQPLPGETE